MKLVSARLHRLPNAEGGSAVLVVLVYLSIMVVLVAANTRTVNWLRRQVELIERQQIERLSHAAADPHPARRAAAAGAHPRLAHHFDPTGTKLDRGDAR